MWKSSIVSEIEKVQEMLGLRQRNHFQKMSPEVPHLKYCFQLWNLQYRRNTYLLDHILRRDTKMTQGMEHLPHENRLREWGLFSLEKRSET